MKSLLIKLLPQIFSAVPLAALTSLVFSSTTVFAMPFGVCTAIGCEPLSLVGVLLRQLTLVLIAYIFQIGLVVFLAKTTDIQQWSFSLVARVLSYTAINIAAFMLLLRPEIFSEFYYIYSWAKVESIMIAALLIFSVALYCFRRLTTKSWIISLFASLLLLIVTLLIVTQRTIDTGREPSCTLDPQTGVITCPKN